MNSIKSIIAANISALRTANGMTQLTLAERLCYSDKAISKWERGESVPDIAVLKQIADLFGVTVDYLITDHSTEKEMPSAPGSGDIRRRNRQLVTLISLAGVWFIGIFIFVLIWAIGGNAYPSVLICCIPACALVSLIFNSIWQLNRHRRITGYISLSVLIWGLLVMLYVFTSAWQLLILGIPAQAVLTLAVLITKKGGTER